MFSWFRKLFSTSPKSVGSLIDRHEICLEIDCVPGTNCTISNPLQTSFDLADIWLGDPLIGLNSSSFLRCWSEHDKREYADKKGVWLIPASDDLHILIAYGEAKTCIKYRDQNNITDPGDSLFFQVPDEYIGVTDVEMRLAVTCLN